MYSSGNFIIVVSCIAFNLFSMQSDAVYKNQCDTAKANSLINFQAFQSLVPTFTKEQINKYKNIFAAEFESHKISLINKKQQLLDDLKTNFSLDEIKWQKCLNLIEAIDDLNELNKDLPVPNNIHDVTIPTFILNQVRKRLSEYSINPARINLVAIQNARYIYQAKTVMPIPCLTENDEWGLNLDHVIHGEIRINVAIFQKLSLSAQVAFYVRMVDDILWNHSAPCFIIEKMTEFLTDSPANLLHSKEFADLKAFYTSYISIFLPCLREPKHIGNMLRMIFDCPETPTAFDDYKRLLEIKNCIEKAKLIENL